MGSKCRCLACGLEFSLRGGVVNLDRRERVVMHAENFIAAHKFGGLHRVVRPHREIVADAQRGEFQFCGFADELHVQRQRGIAGEIKISFRALDDEAAGISAKCAVGHRAGMNGIHEFGAAKIELETAAMVQRMHARSALFVEPGGDFEIGNHQRVGAFGDFHRVADVVAVPVRDEDEIRGHLFYVNGFGERIAGNERVEQAGFFRRPRRRNRHDRSK